MINQEQKEHLHEKVKQSFIDNVKKKFTPRDLIVVKQQRSMILKKVAFFPNLVSITTSGFAIWFYTQDYSTLMKILFLIFGAVMLIGIEYLKRLFLAKGFEGVFQRQSDMIAANLIPLVVIIMPISMFLSYNGGDKVVKTASDPIANVYSLERDSLTAQIDSLQSKIDFEKSQTWRGQIRREAAKAKLIYETQQAVLNDRLNVFIQNDLLETERLNLEKIDRTVSFGIIFGIIACVADLLLSFVFWRAEKDEWDVYLYLMDKGAMQEARKLQDNPFSVITEIPEEKPSGASSAALVSLPDFSRTFIEPSSAMFEFASPEEWDDILQNFSDAEVIEEIKFSVDNTDFGLHNGKIKHTYISKKSQSKGNKITVLYGLGQVNGRIKQYANIMGKYEGDPKKERYYKNNQAWHAYWTKRKTEFDI